MKVLKVFYKHVENRKKLLGAPGIATRNKERYVPNLFTLFNGEDLNPRPETSIITRHNIHALF